MTYDDDPWASALREWADSRLYTVTYCDRTQFDPLPVAFARIVRYLMRVVPLSAVGRQYCAEIVLALERGADGVERLARGYRVVANGEVSLWSAQLALTLYAHVHSHSTDVMSSDKRRQRKFLFEDIADVLVQQRLSEDGDEATELVIDLMLGNIE